MAVKKTAKNEIGKGKAGPGRPKGTPNKTTALLKDAILEAASRAGALGEEDEQGLVKYLQTQAVANPGPFMALLGKVLPMTVAGDEDQPLVHKIIREIVHTNNPDS